MRNNCGAMKNECGRLVRFGLASEINKHIKSSDLIGIGPEGRFMAFECKRPDWRWSGDARERAQFVFILHVLLRGGIAGFVRSVDEMKALMDKHERLPAVLGRRWGIRLEKDAMEEPMRNSTKDPMRNSK
jgi:hypothetical protein